ncbi:MAG: PAM68 family protein [Cyanobacteria bacterium J06634_5]
MASSPDSNNDASSKKARSKKAKSKAASAERTGLPFEPKKARKGSAAKDADDVTSKNRQGKKKASVKQARDSSDKSAVSAKAQARVDEIRAMNRRRAEKDEKAKAAEKNRADDPDSDGSIPEVVSRRMLRRMAVLSGSPVALGVGVFFLAYYLQSNEIITFSPTVILLVTMGCFGLGVLGLTYGVLSASWDDEPGSLVGLSEFKLNFGRVMEARRASKT